MSGVPTLCRTFFVSFLVHAAVIYLVPSIDIFVPAPQYIEINAFLTETEDFIESRIDPVHENQSQEPSDLGREFEHVPTGLEPVEPEMAGDNPMSPEWAAFLPEPRPRVPQSLKVVELTQSVKPSTDTPAPAIIKKEMAPVKEELPQSFFEPDFSRVDRNPTPANEITRTAEKLAQELPKQPEEKPLEQEVFPKFARQETIELPAREGAWFAPAPLILTRTSALKTPSINVSKKYQPIEQNKLDIPSHVLLPEGKDGSETLPLDEVSAKIEETNFSAATDQPQDAQKFSGKQFMFPASASLLYQKSQIQEQVTALTFRPKDERRFAALPEKMPRLESSQALRGRKPVQPPPGTAFPLEQLILPERKDGSEVLPLDEVSAKIAETNFSAATEQPQDAQKFSDEQFIFPAFTSLLYQKSRIQEQVLALTFRPKDERRFAALPEKMPRLKSSQALRDRKLVQSLTNIAFPLEQHKLDTASRVPLLEGSDVLETPIEKTTFSSETEQPQDTQEFPNEQFMFPASTLPLYQKPQAQEQVSALTSRPRDARRFAALPEKMPLLKSSQTRRVRPPIQAPPDIAFSQENVIPPVEEKELPAVTLPPVPKPQELRSASDSERFEDPKRLRFLTNRQQLASESPVLPVVQPASRQRLVLFGSESTDIPVQTERATFGIFVRKEEQPQEFEAPQKIHLPKDDESQPITLQPDKADIPGITIEGPASRREVIYKPLRLPRLTIDTEVTIRLKFWVLPDGTIGDIVPLRRGDTRLERVAIEYIKGWRFTPVAAHSPKVWGIIPITYKLQ